MKYILGLPNVQFEDVDRSYFDGVLENLRPKYRGPTLNWGEGHTEVTEYTKTQIRKLAEKTRKLFLSSDRDTEVIEQQLDSMQKTYVYTKPDGNCLFSAILANMIHPSKYGARDLRKQVALHMALHPDVFYEYVHPLCIAKTNDLDKEGIVFSYESYISSLFDGMLWGDQVIAGAVAHMWQLAINFIFPTGERALKVFHRKDTPHVVIVCNGSSNGMKQETSHFSGTSMFFHINLYPIERF